MRIKGSSDSNRGIEYDIEGLAIFKHANGKGYLIASIQGNNSFAVFDRSGENAYLDSFRIAAGHVDGVQETDGIEAISLPLGSNFPAGIFTCQDGINFDGQTKRPQNFKFVSWDAVTKALRLK